MLKIVPKKLTETRKVLAVGTTARIVKIINKATDQVVAVDR